MKDTAAYLITPSASRNTNGYSIPGTPGRKAVYVERRKVTRSEHYSSLAATRLTTAVFVAYASEYGGEPLIEVGGHLYRIERTYQLNFNDIELTCSDEAT